MDWKALGQKIIGMGLPILGGALGGPAGGMFGTMIAGALGLAPDASPDKIATALSTNSDNVVLLATLQAKHEEVLTKAAYDAQAAAMGSVNKTLQADAHGHGWLQQNHHAIETLTTTFTVVGIYFLMPLMHYPVPDVPSSAWMMLMAICGVTAYQHGEIYKTIAANASAAPPA